MRKIEKILNKIFGKKMYFSERDSIRCACFDILDIARKNGNFVSKEDKVIRFAKSSEVQLEQYICNIVDTFDGIEITTYINDKDVFIKFDKDNVFQLIYTTRKNYDMHLSDWMTSSLFVYVK